MQILNGRYGVYISYKKDNFKIPKTVEHPENLTYDEVMEIVNANPAKPRRTRTTRKK